MSAARLPTALWVSGLMRRVEAAGGFATILHKGEENQGAVLIVTREKDGSEQVFSRVLGPDGRRSWAVMARTEDAALDKVTQYIVAQRRYDPDLWVIELDIAQAQQLIADTDQ